MDTIEVALRFAEHAGLFAIGYLTGEFVILPIIEYIRTLRQLQKDDR